VKEPRRAGACRAAPPPRSLLADYKALLATPSFVFNTLGMCAMTFAIGGLAFWMPTYVLEFGGIKDEAQVNAVFGGIVVVAGFAGTLLGGLAGDWLRDRVAGAYFVVSGVGLLLAFPMLLLVIFLPFPLAWVFVFLAIFWTFFNTGPSNTIIANVTPAPLRATAYAANILVIHTFGDAVSPPLMGAVADAASLRESFLAVSFVLLLGGLFWLCGARYLERDTLAASRANDQAAKPEDAPA